MRKYIVKAWQAGSYAPGTALDAGNRVVNR